MALENGLSRVRSDPHARFLGGGGAAMPRCYPTATFCDISGVFGNMADISVGQTTLRQPGRAPRPVALATQQRSVS
ncbi:hypothetical protein ELI11_12315 [Rhizobium ruizarguesonis]|nr:hypothetical protein ELI11_12315 [Rhizobium ruizarguesonis]